MCSVLMKEMQHKLADSWKNIHDSEYLTMAKDEGDDVNYSLLPTSISSSSASNIVRNVFKKSNGLKDEVCKGDVASGLEQKIQELRAEKEARGFNKCPSPIHNDQDSPLDFSIKRRTSFSGSLTDDSQTSSSSPGHMTDYSTMSPSADPGCVHDNSGVIKRATPSPDDDSDQRHFCPPKFGVPSVILPPLLSGLDVFSGIPSNLLNNGSAMNALSHIDVSIGKDPRNKRNSRPFKAYPKEALQMPLGAFGIPGLTPAAIQQGLDLGMFVGMSNKDLVNLYQQQFQFIRDSKTSMQSSKLSASSHFPSFNGKHYLQQQSHYHNSSPPAMSSSSSSPPLIATDDLRTTTTPSITFQAPNTPGSMNSTLVSSTSTFALCNSRKRPRSLPDDQKDAAYWERRRKNNDAAKRSRDARRAKEDEIAMRATLLEQENLKLRVEVAALKTETERLRCLLYEN